MVGCVGGRAEDCKAFRIACSTWGSGLPVIMLLSRDSCLQVRMVTFLSVLDTGLGAKR